MRTKSQFGREIALLSLPVVILVGAAWWQTRATRESAASLMVEDPLKMGPARLEFSPSQEVELTPADVYRGFTWMARTTLETRGTWKAPANWRLLQEQGASNAQELRLVFRRGKIWKRAAAVKKGSLVDAVSFLSFSQSTLKVNLSMVPRDAEEIRLRGWYQRNLVYSGVLPPQWKPPQNLETQPNLQFLLIKSKPFDIPIKGVNEPMPAPRVSRTPYIEFVSAGWFYRPSIHSFGVRLRDNSGRQALQKTAGLQVLDYSIKDGNGKQIIPYPTMKIGQRSILKHWQFASEELPPNLPKNEVIARFVSSFVDPQDGWNEVVPPLRLDATITDGISWPLRVRAVLSQQSGDLRSLERPQPSKPIR